MMNRSVLTTAAVSCGMIVLSLSTNVSAIGIDPLAVSPGLESVDGTGTGPAALNVSEVETAAGLSAGTLNFLYKDNVGGAEEGPFAGLFETDFTATPGDPSGFTLTYSGLGTVLPSEAYLLVKNGNHDPFWYLFDLNNVGGDFWDISLNNPSTISGSNFWPSRGAISHVGLYAGNAGTPTDPFGTPLNRVPDGGTSLMLLGLSLLGFGIGRKLMIRSKS